VLIFNGLPSGIVLTKVSVVRGKTIENYQNLNLFKQLIPILLLNNIICDKRSGDLYHGAGLRSKGLLSSCCKMFASLISHEFFCYFLSAQKVEKFIEQIKLVFEKCGSKLNK